MRKGLFLLPLVCLPFFIKAQSTDTTLMQKGPEYLVQAFFKALSAKDTAALRQLMLPEVELSTVKKSGELEKISRQAFLDQLGEIRLPIEERVSIKELQSTDLMAQAWLPYRFYLNGAYSHCGVNHLFMIRRGERWWIKQVIDTRKKHCAIDSLTTAGVHAFVDQWHQAASEANEEQYFNMMAEGSVFIGTDSSERWTKTEFQQWAKPHFKEAPAWAFTPLSRQLRFLDNGLVLFDELLETQMGVCRSTGLLRKEGGDYQVVHYQLSLTLDNDKLPAFLELLD